MGLLLTPGILMLSGLCLFTIVFVGSSPVANRQLLTEEDEPWLADGRFYDVVDMDDIPQADEGASTQTIMCPAVTKKLPKGGCNLKVCHSDRECASQGLMCCYNGCVYTCLPQLRPAAFFDWLRQPVHRLKYGTSWLIPGTEQNEELTECTITPPDDDSDPLICPDGFQCVSDDWDGQGRGQPETGRCVQLQDNTSKRDSQVIKSQTLSKHSDVKRVEKLEHHCKVSANNKLLSGHTMILNGKKCLCIEAELICDDKATPLTKKDA